MQKTKKKIDAEYYNNNKARFAKHRDDNRARNLAFINEYKQLNPCICCGEADPVCLTFHHRDPREKDLDISLGARRCWSIERIKREIEKCDVLCCNCHAKEHDRLKRLRNSMVEQLTLNQLVAGSSPVGVILLWVRIPRGSLYGLVTDWNVSPS